MTQPDNPEQAFTTGALATLPTQPTRTFSGGQFRAIYPSAVEREAATRYSENDIGRAVLQLSPLEIWIVTDVVYGVPVWGAVTIEPATAIWRGAVRVNTPAPSGDPVVYRREEVDALLVGGNALDLLTTVDPDDSIMFLCTEEGRPIWYQPGG